MTNYPMISCEGVTNRIEDELSSYSNSGLMDTDKFYPRIRVFIEKLGIAGYTSEDAVVVVKDYRALLPCNFYLLDSAWLCDSGNTFTQSNFQGKFEIYTTKTCGTVSVDGCGYKPSYDILPIMGCNSETELDKITITEVIKSEPNTITWQNPVLMSLGNKVTKNMCSGKCSNIFSKNPQNISIKKEGNDYILYSNIKDATIYIKYYAYPYDENNLPQIPDSPIFEEALFYDLMLYFFKQRWYNGELSNVENKIKSLEDDKRKAMAEAEGLMRLNSFRSMVEIAKRNRGRTEFWETNFYNRPNFV